MQKKTEQSVAQFYYNLYLVNKYSTHNTTKIQQIKNKKKFRCFETQNNHDQRESIEVELMKFNNLVPLKNVMSV